MISTLDWDAPLRHDTSGRFGSQSSTVTLAFCFARIVETTKVVVLLPAPPFGLATAMTGMASSLWAADDVRGAGAHQQGGCSCRRPVADYHGDPRGRRRVGRWRAASMYPIY